MADILSHMATVFMGLFAIMNPIANTPVFIGLTSDDDPATKKAIAFKSTSLAFLIVLKAVSFVNPSLELSPLFVST